MKKEQLIKFEEWCVDTYKKGLLRSPLHLSGSINGELEDFLIELFKKIKKDDYVFSTYRSHHHALLKGIPEEWLKNWILENKSIHVMNKEHKFFTSAIVAGTLPIALGTAMAIKRKNQNNHVYIFIGDMTARTGMFWECWNYAVNHDLPITFVIEDNGLSTDTPTGEVWNLSNKEFYERHIDVDLTRNNETEKIKYIKYTRRWPHYGCNVFVNFDDKKIEQGGSNF